MTRQYEEPSYTSLQQADTPSALEKFIYLLRQLLIVLIIPGAIIAGAVYYGKHLKDTGPKAQRRERIHNAPLVEVSALTPGNQTIVVQAMGTVIPSRKISLYPQVTGRIIEMDEHLEPGGRFTTGQTMLKLDPADYQLAVDQRQAQVDQVEADYRIEEGQQAIAKQEFELLGQNVTQQDKDLILRKPQLQTMAAKLKIAQSQLQQARLDLERTTIKAPFNALVIERNVNVGSHVTTGTALTQLVGTDTYWVQVSIPVDQLKWITIPTNDNQTGSRARVYNEAAWGRETYRIGHVVRLSGSLEEEGRMAQLIVAVDDPIALKKENVDTPLLILDSYVRVEIEGVQLQNVYQIPRTALKHDDTLHIFKDGKLDIRDIRIVYRGPMDVIVDHGLQPNDMLVMSDINAPVQDMPIRVEGQNKLARTEASGTSGDDKSSKASEQ